MSEDAQSLNPLFRMTPHRVGDPAVLLDAILQNVEAPQKQQVIGLYLDSVSATLEANLKLVQGIRAIVAGKTSAAGR